MVSLSSYNHKPTSHHQSQRKPEWPPPKYSGEAHPEVPFQCAPPPLSLSHSFVFLQCFDTVGWVIWPVKLVPDMTNNVFGGTLNLAQSINPTLCNDKNMELLTRSGEAVNCTVSLSVWKWEMKNWKISSIEKNLTLKIESLAGVYRRSIFRRFTDRSP